MGPNRRPARAGARTGALSEEVRSALRDEARRLETVGEPVEVIKAVADTFAALDAEIELIAQVRLAAIRQLRGDGWSYDRIAAETGLSKARVAQLSRDPRHP